MEHLRVSVIFSAIVCTGCMEIPLTNTAPAASAMVSAVRVGMSPDEVHVAIGKPAYTERARTVLGVETNRLQEVYERSVDSKHFYIQLVSIGCGSKNGVFPALDEYKIVVQYDGATRVSSFEVVPSWLHGQDEDTHAVDSPPLSY